MKPFSGVISLVPTPLKKNGDVDKEDLEKIINYQFENGCDGVGVLAGIGEGYLLTGKTKTDTIKMAVDSVNSRGPLIVGCPAMGTDEAVVRVKEAADYGADAVLAFKPLPYRKYTTEESYRHFKAQAEAADILLVPYARDEDLIAPSVVKRLVDGGYTKHLKYGYHSTEVLKEIASLTGDKLYRFCGADTWTLRLLLQGCDGIMTATAAIFPKENVELLKLVKGGKIDEARKLWYNKFLLWNDSGFYENWQWVHKYALKLMGIFKSDIVAPPQPQGTEYQKGEIKALLEHLKVI
jgi:dihydrodipicolinate synthase/N-acetylneuraminate lyase